MAGDDRLELVRAGLKSLHRGSQQVVGFSNGVSVPLRPVLILQKNEVTPAVKPSAKPGPLKQLQGKESLDLGVAVLSHQWIRDGGVALGCRGHEMPRHPRETNGFFRQVDPDGSS